MPRLLKNKITLVVFKGLAAGELIRRAGLERIAVDIRTGSFCAGLCNFVISEKLTKNVLLTKKFKRLFHMNIQDAITNRRAVKAFDPDHMMSAEEIDELLGLALLSPTAFNIQNWRFVAVTDAELRSKLREVSWDQAQVTDASLLVILCADVKSWEKEPERYWRNAPKEAQDFLLPAIDNYYRGHEQVQRDEAMRSCGMAAQTIMLAAKSMGYDTCPMDGFDFEKVGELINLPDDHVIAMYVAVGKKVEDAKPRGGQLPLDEVVIRNAFK